MRPLSGDWEEFKNLSDEEVHLRALSDPDALPTDPSMWRNARVVMPATKQLTSIRLDPDLLDWFKKSGRGYQTRINAVLRSYMDAHKQGRHRAKT